MKIKKKHIFRFFGPFFFSFIIFGWVFVENEKNHQKSTVLLLHFWLSKQKNYFWSHAKSAKMSSFQCTVGGGLPSYIHSFSCRTKIDKLFLLEISPIYPVGPWGKRPTFSFAWETRVLLRSNKFMNVEEGNMLFNFSTKGGYREICWKALWYI